MRGFFLSAALAMAVFPAHAADAADPMEDFDATVLRSFTIQKCHASQDEADREVMARVPQVRQAALDQLWARFDKADPAHHDENGKTARETLDRRTEAHDRFIQSQVIEYGCEWLDGKFRPSD